MTNPKVSTHTRRWMEQTLTRDEIIRWGADTITALAALIDSVTQEDA